MPIDVGWYGWIVGRVVRAPLVGPPAERLIARAAARWPSSRWVRAAIWHAGQALPREPRALELPGGARMVATLEYRWRDAYFRGPGGVHDAWTYEPELTRFVQAWLRPGDVFIDVGANVGYFTAIGARAVGEEGWVHAFEPNPDILPLLRATVDLNDFGRRTTVNACALGSRPGRTVLFRGLDPHNSGVSTTARTSAFAEHVEAEGVEVAIDTVDGFVRRHGIGRIRLMKVDVEGAELEVLRGAATTLASVRPDAVVTEFAPENLADPRQAWHHLVATLAAAWYRPYLLGGADPRGTPRALDEVPSWASGNVLFLPVPEGEGVTARSAPSPPV